MYRLKRYIENLRDRVVNKDIYITGGVLYLDNGENKYIYQYDEYYIKAGDNWINMQGGIPIYEVEENLDEDIFVEVVNE